MPSHCGAIVAVAVLGSTLVVGCVDRTLKDGNRHLTCMKNLSTPRNLTAPYRQANASGAGHDGCLASKARAAGTSALHLNNKRRAAAVLRQLPSPRHQQLIQSLFPSQDSHQDGNAREEACAKLRAFRVLPESPMNKMLAVPGQKVPSCPKFLPCTRQHFARRDMCRLSHGNKRKSTLKDAQRLLLNAPRTHGV